MRRRLARPQNPEALGRLFAALRVYSGQRQPKNATERRVNDALKGQKLSRAGAKRMVGTLDSLPKGPRTKLLGKIAAPNFVPPARAEAPTTAPLTVTIPAGAVERLGHALRSDVGLDVQDRLGEGPREKPVYTINYRGLWCEHETVPYRFWATGSDEIYVITSAVHIDAGNNIVRTERHPVAGNKRWYEAVDSGEARIGPVAPCWRGNSDPVCLTVVVFEHDKGDPDAYKEEVNTLVNGVVTVTITLYPGNWLEALRGTIPDAVNWLLDTGDDLIEAQTVVNPGGLLEWYAGQYRGTYVGQAQQPTGLEYHFMTTHRGEGATYVLGFEVTREPPLPMPEGPFL